MKNLIIILSFIFASKSSFGQFVKAGYFYELSNLWSMDSVSVKQLLDTYKLDISKLDTGVLELLSPLLCEIEELGQPLNFLDFF